MPDPPETDESSLKRTSEKNEVALLEERLPIVAFPIAPRRRSVIGNW